MSYDNFNVSVICMLEHSCRLLLSDRRDFSLIEKMCLARRDFQCEIQARASARTSTFFGH